MVEHAAAMTAGRSQASTDALADAELEVIRSEEALHLGIAVRERGRVRISKRIVTEQRTITVTVRREELVVTQIPSQDPVDEAADDAEAPAHDPAGGLLAMGDFTGIAGPDGRLLDLADTGPILDLVLHEERVTTSTVVVPCERVRVHLNRVAGSTDVVADLAREVVTAEVTNPSLINHTPGPERLTGR